MSAPYTLLIVEDDPLFARTLRIQLGQGPFKLIFCVHTALALQHLSTAKVDLILLDIHLGGHEEGLVALPKLIAAAPHVPVVVHSVLSDHTTVVRAMRQGAHDYIPKHVGIKTLGAQLTATIANHKAHGSKARAAPLTAPDAGGRAMLGQSEAMMRLHADIAHAQRSQGSVIILGEPGSGKELVARALRRKDAPFVAVDASTLDNTLATGALFGHEKGSFTGADDARAGLFEQAHGGMLYFDEIANMSVDVQAKLLRVLQEREVTRLGGTRKRPLSFRLVCATHSDLTALARVGQFRFDLLTRLQVFVLTVPPLRARKSDIPELFRAFVARFCNENGANPCVINDAVWPVLTAYDWHGNVRELEHVAQYAVAACSEGTLRTDHLPQRLFGAAPEGAGLSEPQHAASGPKTPVAQAVLAQAAAPIPRVAHDVPQSDQPAGFYDQVLAFEQRALVNAYAAHRGNISAMARNLHMDRSSLYAKLRLHGIHTPRPS